MHSKRCSFLKAFPNESTLMKNMAFLVFGILLVGNSVVAAETLTQPAGAKSPPSVSTEQAVTGNDWKRFNREQ